MPKRFLAPLLLLLALLAPWSWAADTPGSEKHLLYVAAPGVRDLLEYGGHGLLVFDIDNGHQFVKRIPTVGLNPSTGKPSNVKGVCASAKTGRLYISVLHSLTCIDLVTEKVLWEKPYPGGCDRMSIAPDGSFLYVPSLESDHWHVLDADGNVIVKITPKSGAHNTVVGLDGKEAFLAGLKSPILTIAETSKHEATRTCGPFSAPIRPFTVNGTQTRIYACLNELLGFEIGDLKSGKVLHRVEVPGLKFDLKKIKRHGCPSHGVALTPDEKEIWVTDATNERLHIFDNTVMPPKYLESIKLSDEPGWITFTIDGRFAYPSSGEVIDPKTRKILSALKDEAGRNVRSEKMLEIITDKDGKFVRTGDQFGLGRVMQ